MARKISETLRRLLSGLGDTPEAIAEGLTCRGLLGTPRDARDCPIGRHLLACGMRCVTVTARVTAADPGREGTTLVMPLIFLPNGPALLRFTRDFDLGRYPELERERSPRCPMSSDC